jgi:short-subunit dehydrogenase
MVDVFGATSTTEDVLSGVNLHGKRILVTGVSAGIGVETARSLAAPALRLWARRGIWLRLKRQLHRC